MKKKLLSILAIFSALSFALVSCGATPEPEPEIKEDQFSIAVDANEKYLEDSKATFTFSIVEGAILNDHSINDIVWLLNGEESGRFVARVEETKTVYDLTVSVAKTYTVTAAIGDLRASNSITINALKEPGFEKGDPVDDIGQTTNQNGFLYRAIADGKYELLSYDGKDPNPVIPDTVGNNKVVSVASYAFIHNDLIESVTIGTNVVTIENYAFFDCSILAKVVFKSNSVLRIGDGVFAKDELLTTITLPNSLLELGVGAFSYCTALEKIAIPETVTEIPNHLFYCCTSLEEVTTGDNVTSYGMYAFYKNSALLEISLAKATESIGDDCFAHCTSLTSIVFPSKMTKMGSYVLFGCNKLEEVTIPFVGKDPSNNSRYPFGYLFGNTQYEDSYAVSQKYIVDHFDLETEEHDANTTSATYYLPESLVKVTMNNNNPTFGAFMNCTSLLEIQLYPQATIIEDYAFQNCVNLPRIIIPNTVKRIEGSPFEGVDPELFVFYYGTKSSFASLKWTKPLTNIFYNYTGATITYKFKDGNTVVDTITSKVDIVMPDFEKPGYTFNGWYDESLGFYTADSRFYSPTNISFDADYDPIDYNIITPYLGGDAHIVYFFEDPESQQPTSHQIVDSENGLVYPELPVKEGSVFLGWYEWDNTFQIHADHPFDFTQTISAPITYLDAMWYELDDTEITPLSFENATVTLKNGVATSNDYIDYYFAFAPLKTTFVQMSVETDSEQVPSLLSVTNSKDDVASLVVYNDSLSGYAYRETVYFIKLTAHRTATQVTFTFGEDLLPLDGGLGQDGTGYAKVPVTYNTNFNLPVDNYDGYRFLYWYDFFNETPLTDADGLSLSKWRYLYDVLVSPKYELINYPITYNIDKQYVVESYYPSFTRTYTIESGEVQLPYLQVKGYNFLGWCTDEGLTSEPIFSIPAGSFEPFDLYPKLEEGITVNYDLGDKIIHQTYHYGDTITQMSSPTRDGYVFAGWYTDKTFTTRYDFSEPISEHLTVYAKWNQLFNANNHILMSGYEYISAINYNAITIYGDDEDFTYMVANVDAPGKVRVYYANYLTANQTSAHIYVINENGTATIYDINCNTTSFSEQNYQELDLHPGDIVIIKVDYVPNAYRMRFSFKLEGGLVYGYPSVSATIPA